LTAAIRVLIPRTALLALLPCPGRRCPVADRMVLVLQLMGYAHLRWLACQSDTPDMFGDSECDFWFGCWRALDAEGLRLLPFIRAEVSSG